MDELFPRQINFEAVFNFRDLGGYRTRGGSSLVWRRLFRSGNLYNLTKNDLHKLSQDLRITTVLDLRSSLEIEQQGIGLLSGSGISYYNISLITDGGNRQANEQRYKGLTNMGEFYSKLVRQKGFGKRIIEALEIIAEPANHPLVFHCSAGKDRTGILAAILLSTLKVADEDIISDFSLTAPYIEALLSLMKNDAQMAEDAGSLPAYFWQASPDLMELFLTAFNREYGSARRYLEEHGAEASLFDRLERALLA